MPAGAWAVPFAVGECSRPTLSRDPREEAGGIQEPQLRGLMAGQASGRIDDTLLVREAQRGNRAAFEELVRSYDQAVLRLALHLTGSEHEAQDVYQEAFLKAYKSIGNFRFECSFYTWIYRIVTNLCLDQLRRRKTRREDHAVVLDHSGDEIDVLASVSDDRSFSNPAKELDRKVLGLRIQAALGKLTPRERMV